MRHELHVTVWLPLMVPCMGTRAKEEWQAKKQCFVQKASFSAVTKSICQSHSGKASDFGVMLTIPTGKYNKVELGYWRAYDSGDLRAPNKVSVFGANVANNELLNTYYTLMFAAINGQGGVVNQIIGSGSMSITLRPRWAAIRLRGGVISAAFCFAAVDASRRPGDHPTCP